MLSHYPLHAQMATIQKIEAVMLMVTKIRVIHGIAFLFYSSIKTNG